MKFISLATMTGQEKYQAEQERKDAQKVAESKRQAATERDTFAEGAEKTASIHLKRAAGSRAIADKIRHL